MNEYVTELEKITTVGELFALLKKKFCAKSDADLAEKLMLAKATLHRMKSEERVKCQCTIENAEKLVKGFAKDSPNDEDMIRNIIYGLLYDADIKKEKLSEFEQKKISQQEHPEKKIIASAECDLLNELSQKMREIVIKLVASKERSIKEEKTSEYGNNIILFMLDEGCYNIFGFPIIDMIYAIAITKENYNEMVHIMVERDAKDGVIILFCSDMAVLDKAWRDDKIQIDNNVVLYSLDGERKVYVKSTRKEGKKALKYLFGDTNLVFSK